MDKYQKELARQYRFAARKEEMISMPSSFENYGGRQCVLYIKNGREHRTAWFKSETLVRRAFEIMKARFGQAIIYLD